MSSHIRVAAVAALVLGVWGCQEAATRPATAATGPATESAAAVAPAPSGAAAAAPAEAAEPYRLTAADVNATVGQSGTLAVVVEVVGGYKWNDEFPAALRIPQPESAQVRFPKAQVAKGEPGLAAEHEKATLSLPFEARAAGETKVAAKIDFSVCTEKKCLIFRDKDVEVAVRIQ